MHFISFCEQYPVIDILPVQKGLYFDGGIRQLFYSRVACIKDNGFLFDLMKFEQNPIVMDNSCISENDSTVSVSFNFSHEQNSPIITIILNSQGRSIVYLKETEYLCLENVSCYKGYDEQGWYWGVRFMLSLDFLQDIYGNIFFDSSSVLRGNIYASLNEVTNKHFVSVAPFYSSNMFSPQNHSEFMLLR